VLQADIAHGVVRHRHAAVQVGGLDVHLSGRGNGPVRPGVGEERPLPIAFDRGGVGLYPLSLSRCVVEFPIPRNNVSERRGIEGEALRHIFKQFRGTKPCTRSLLRPPLP
jgi:hypothetical protein